MGKRGRRETMQWGIDARSKYSYLIFARLKKVISVENNFRR